MTNDNATLTNQANNLSPIGGLRIPEIDLTLLPAKVSKRLWVSPTEFVELTAALTLAEWALQVSEQWCWQLPDQSRRGPKPIYRDQSILVIALIQVAWQMSYEEVIDYLRAHPAVTG